MKFKSLEIIKALEEQIETGYSLKIFRGYVAINKRGAEKLIDELYANLPDDVKAAREFLKTKNHQTKSNGNSQIFDNIKEFENKIDGDFQIATHVIVNVREMEKLVNKIYKALPEEITEAEVLSKQ
jgi:hypothetical protein